MVVNDDNLQLDRRLSRKDVEIFYQMQLNQLLFTSTSLNLTDLHLDDSFLVQMCGYIDYLITGEDPAIRRLYFNSMFLMRIAYEKEDMIESRVLFISLDGVLINRKQVPFSKYHEIGLLDCRWKNPQPRNAQPRRE